MRWIDILSFSLANLLRRKLRSFLTMLGVVIGTAAIIVTISLGFGAEKTQMDMLQSKTNLRVVSVYPFYGSGPSEEGSARRVTKITDSVIRQLRAIPNVDAVTPFVSIWGGASFILKTGKYENYTWLTAVNPKDFAKIAPLKSGSYFTSRTDRMEFLMSELCMMEFRDPKKTTDEYPDIWSYIEAGKDLPVPKINYLQAKYDLVLHWEDWEDVDSTTNEPKIHEQSYKASMQGILKLDMDDGNFGYYGYSCVVSLDWYKKFYKDNKKLFKDLQMSDASTYDSVFVVADTVENVAQLTKDLKEFGLNCYSLLDSIKTMQDQIRTMQAFMGFIGGISMLVAALSIANTMMMSIYERTREIGVMKVLGCKMGNIRMMFLSEAAYIGIFGGLMGLICSYSLSYALNNVEGLQKIVADIMSGAEAFGGANGATTSIIPPFLSLGTWAAVTLISVASGFYPAQRAMQLSSLAAIRSAD